MATFYGKAVASPEECDAGGFDHTTITGDGWENPALGSSGSPDGDPDDGDPGGGDPGGGDPGGCDPPDGDFVCADNEIAIFAEDGFGYYTNFPADCSPANGANQWDIFDATVIVSEPDTASVSLNALGLQMILEMDDPDACVSNYTDELRWRVSFSDAFGNEASNVATLAIHVFCAGSPPVCHPAHVVVM